MSGLSEYAMNTERHKDIFSCFLDILQMSFDFILDLNKFRKEGYLWLLIGLFFTQKHKVVQLHRYYIMTRAIHVGHVTISKKILH